MGTTTTHGFHGVSQSGSTYTITGGAPTAGAINWTETDTVNDDFDIGGGYTEPGFGAATYLGQIVDSTNGQVWHLFDQGGFQFITAHNSSGPTWGDTLTFDSADLSIVITDHCFAPDTEISTPGGTALVQDLGIGDDILTADGRTVAVKWIGRQAVSKLFGMSIRREPVRIATGALGDGLPVKDLTVSADHGMILDDLVVNASALVNGTTVAFVPMAELSDDFTYYHIETEAHDVILANGAISETYLDIPGRKAFDNYAEYLDLYGVERIIPEMDRPRISSQRLLPEALRARLGICEMSFDFEAALKSA